MMLLCLLRKRVVKDLRLHIVRNYVRPKLFAWDTEQMKEEVALRRPPHTDFVRLIRKHVERFENHPEEILNMTKLTRLRLAVGGSEVPIFYNHWHWL